MAKNLVTTITIGGKVSGTLGKAFSSISNLSNKAFNNINKLNNTGVRIGENVGNSISSLESKLKGLVAAKLISSGIGAIKNGGTAMIDQAAKLEQYRNTLNVVMKDQGKAAEAYSWAVQYANKTPFETDEIVDATVKLTSYGLEAQKVLPVTGDMAGAMGKSIDQAVEAIADAQTGELERLKEFGITKDMIVQQGAKDLAGIELVNNKGQITNQRAFNAAMFSLMKERYNGAMEIQSKTFNGVKSTISGMFKNTIASMAGISADGSIVSGSAFDYIRGKAQLLADKMQEMNNNGQLQELSNKFLEFTKYVGGGIDAAIPKVEYAFNYISTHGDQVKTVIKAIGTGFAAWKTINTISNGINAIRQVHNNVMLLKNSLGLLKVAKAKDKIETIQLKALYIQDVAARKAHTIATTIQAAKTSVLNKIKIKERAHAIATMAINAKDAIVRGAITTATTAQAAAQWLLNSAFLACPITWIVIGIVALIAVFALLWNKSEGFRNFFINMWNTIMATLKSVDAWINSAMVSDWTTSFGALGYIVSAAVNFVGGIWNSVKTIIYGVIAFINGVFAGDWAAAWNGIVQIFSGIFSGIETIAKAPINAIIGMVNGAISAVNSLSVSIPDFVPGVGGQTFSPNIPTVPQFANGGIANGPSIFGEAGREMAIPLERNRPRSIGLLNQTAKELGVKEKSKDNKNVYVFAPKVYGSIDENTKQYLDEKFEEFINSIDEIEREKERVEFA